MKAAKGRGKKGRPPRSDDPTAQTTAIDPDPRVLTADLTRWFAGVQRALPWRATPRNPYHALVSEAMLQQTQVSRVLSYFERFIGAFPTVAALAAADEHDVLALWSGLGYYRRARNLHAAARLVVERFGGVVPGDAENLRQLPGVGRYTAGAIAAIAFGRAEAAVDGNVVRVLLRLHGRDLDPSAKTTADWAWKRAGELAQAAAEPGAVAEGLMELGATVCLPPPAAPQCLVCPWRERCRAFAEGSQNRIPRPRKRASGERAVYCASVVIADERGRVLLERRPIGGMWAQMWQAPTLEREDRASTPDEAGEFARVRGAGLPLASKGSFVHQTTHRRVCFEVYAARAVRCGRKASGREWVEAGRLEEYGLSSAQKRVLELARVAR